jgi:hypothetical protein
VYGSNVYLSTNTLLQDELEGLDGGLMEETWGYIERQNGIVKALEEKIKTLEVRRDVMMFEFFYVCAFNIFMQATVNETRQKNETLMAEVKGLRQRKGKVG